MVLIVIIVTFGAESKHEIQTLEEHIKLGRFKLEMNWNQEELEQWAIAARQKEEDAP